MTEDFFRNRLDQMIDLRHPLAVLANRMPWQEIEASLAQRWARQVKAGKRIEDLDLFGSVMGVVGGGVSNAGRPRLPTRLMVALLYLKHPKFDTSTPISASFSGHRSINSTTYDSGFDRFSKSL